MSHSKARLTFHGRLLLVERVIVEGWAVSHAAKAQGVSRQCAHRWINRYRQLGEAGLHDRSSRPRSCPSRTPRQIEDLVIQTRLRERVGQDRIAAMTGVPARTVNRILRRWQLPMLSQLDPITGHIIRASKKTTLRYEHDRPGSLVHTDVKKLGRIPDGGGWRLHGRQMGSTAASKKARIGFDYVHSLVDDYSRYAYSQILPDEQGPTTAGFLARALDHFASIGISVERLMSDNHFSYKNSHDVADVLAERGIRHVFIKPHCPWQNGKVERFNKTLQAEWAYRHPFTSNGARTDALAPWLDHYNQHRPHTALGGQPPISRLSPT